MRRAAVAAVGVAVLSAVLIAVLGRSRIAPRTPTLDATRPANAVARIGVPTFGPVGGVNTELVAMSPDGTRLYVCDPSGVLRAFDAESAVASWEVVPHPDWVPARPKTIRQRISALELRFRDYRQIPADVAASPAGDLVATCAGAMVRAFDASTGEFVAEAPATVEPQQLLWTADGRAVLWSDGGRIARWEPRSDSTRWSGPLPTNFAVLHRTADATIVARCVPANGPATYHTLDPASLAPGPPPRAAPDGWSHTFVFDRNGRELVERWDETSEHRGPRWALARTDGGEPDPLPDPLRSPLSMAYYMVAPGRSVGFLTVSREIALTIDDATARLAFRFLLRGLATSEDGTRAAVCELGRVRIFDARTRSYLRSADEIVSSTAFATHPDGRRVYAASCDSVVLECDAGTGAVLRRFDVRAVCGLRGVPDAGLRVSPDGRRVAGVGFEIDLGSGRTSAGPSTLTDGVAWRDGSLVRVAAGNPGWVIASSDGGEDVPLEGLDDVVSFDGGFRFHTDGSTLFARIDGKTHEWDTRTGRELASSERRASPASGESGYERRPAQKSLNGRVMSVEDWLLGETYVRLAEPLPYDGDVAAVDPARVALGRASGDIVILRRSDGREVARIAGPRSVRALEFLPGTDWIACGGPDGTITILRLSVAEPVR